MAISFVGSGTGVETPALPAHRAGDLIVVFAYRGDAATNIAADAGFTSSQGGFGNQNAHRVGYKIAAGANESGGVWSGATNTLALVYRGVDQASPIGATAQFTNVADILYPALTLQVTDGTSHVLAVHGRRVGNVEQPTPPATTKRGDTGSSASSRIEGFGSGPVSSWSQLATGGNNGQRYRSVSIEMRAAAVAAEKRTGQGDATIGRVTGEGSGRVRVTGRASSALAPITSAGSGRLAGRGGGAGDLAPIFGEASGRVAIIARGDATLAPITSEARGGPRAGGIGDATLCPISGEAFGRSPRRGRGDATLAPITGSSLGAIGGDGTVGRGDGLVSRILGEATGRVSIRGWADAVVTIAAEARGNVSRPHVRPSLARTVRPAFQPRVARPPAESRMVLAIKSGADMEWPAKDPDERLDYSIDWTDRLAGDGIASVTWIVPDDLVRDDASVAGAATTIWLSGGRVNRSPSITCRITTVDGRTMDQSVTLPIRHR